MRERGEREDGDGDGDGHGVMVRVKLRQLTTSDGHGGGAMAVGPRAMNRASLALHGKLLYGGFGAISTAIGVVKLWF